MSVSRVANPRCTDALSLSGAHARIDNGIAQVGENNVTAPAPVLRPILASRVGTDNRGRTRVR
jgi:hypothetical protein